MGYKIIQLAEAEGSTYAVIMADAEADLSALPDYTDGSVCYIKDDPDKLFVKMGEEWALMNKTGIPPGPHIDLDGVNPYHLMISNLLFARRMELAEVNALLTQGNTLYSILPDLPTREAELFEGMIVYAKDDKSLSVLTTPGEEEVDTLTVTTGAVTSDGNITITLNEEDVVVAVLEEDTAAEVAAKIKKAVDDAVTAKTVAAWAVARDGAKLTFTKGEVGTCAAPSAADTDTTGCVFSDFARTNEGAASVWGSLINAS